MVRKAKSKVNRKLYAARRKNFWTMRQAAEAIGVCPSVYCCWENGLQTPRPTSLKLLCEAFGVTDPGVLGF
jgi:transcriptional regulator with XRE-family HTH domain